MTAYPYENPVDPESVNIRSDRLAKVVERFQKQHADGLFPGGQLVLRRNGKLVLNETIGIARGFRPGDSDDPVPVQPNTAFLVLSAGKPFAAIVIAMLEDRGLLDVNAPVAAIFPEFARNGKEHITTLDVLTHRSGIQMPDFVAKLHLWGDREAIQQALIETRPVYPRGTSAYAVYEYGWILNEIVLRVDGRSLPDFFVDELAAPLQLPALRYGLAGRDLDSLAFSYWLGKDELIVGGTNVAATFEGQNSVQFLDSRNPAVSMVSDAANLAAFYGFILNGGEAPDGQQLISEKMLRQCTSRHVYAWDRSLKMSLPKGRGFMLGSLIPSNYGWWNTGSCFGHAGGYCSLAFGDYSTNIAVAIVTNGNKSPGDLLTRFTPLAHGLRAACKQQASGGVNQ